MSLLSRLFGGKSARAAWTADPELSTQLGEAETFGAYRIRPAAAMTRRDLDPQHPSADRFMYVGTAHADNYTPIFSASFTPIAEQTGKKADLQSLIAPALRSFKSHHTDTAILSEDVGTIGSLEFIRVTIQGTRTMNSGKQVEVRSIFLSGWDGDGCVSFAGQDSVPYADESLKLMEASACTLERVAA